MKLATLPGPGRDGRLAVVSRDLTRAVLADDIAPTLQSALDHWDDCAAALKERASALEAGGSGAFAFDQTQALAPLPRAWQWLDGSAFTSHGELMQKAYGIAPIESVRPLMYQGMSHRFLGAGEDVALPSEDDGIDFEGEFGVIVGDVRMGTTTEDALRSIRLLVLVNDWSLRALGAEEMKTGFGWVQAKPACSLGPVAVTPDELGSAWRDARVQLPLLVALNGSPFGAPHGGAMSVGFDALIAHAARTRDLCAGTVIGSGTVSNATAAEVGSACMAERRALETIAAGAPGSSFLKFGDRVRMECLAEDRFSLFGAIDQTIVRAGGAAG